MPTTRTINAICPSQESSNMRAVNIIHGFLPFVASLFYLISAVALALCRRPDSNIRKPPRVIIAWPMFFVLVTYTIDAIMLFYLPFMGKVTAFLDNTFFSFTSAFSWFVLLMEFIWYRDCKTVLFPLGGYAAMYLTAEALLFAFRSRPAASVDMYDIIRMIRLGALLILLSVVAISRAIHARPRCMDEEEVPLLQDAYNRPHYGSTARNEDLDSQRQNNQSVLEYTIPRVKRLAPLVWPRNRPYMLYFGILFFLILDRIIVVLCPLQIGRITDILANNGIFSWTDIATTISVTVLASSEVSPMVQSYLWLFIEERSHLELKRAVFDKALNVPNTLGKHANMDNLKELVRRGKSIQTLFSSMLLTIIPMSTDILLGVVVLYYIYGAYMAITPTLVVVTSLWSFTELHGFLKRNHQQFVAYGNREQPIFQDSTSTWQTALYPGYMPYQITRYSSAIAGHMNFISRHFSTFCIDTAFRSSLVMIGFMGGCMLVAIQVFLELETVGSFITLLMYLTRLGSNLRCLESGVRAFILGLADTNDVHNLFDRMPDASAPKTKTRICFEQGSVEFNDIHFAYRGQKRVLKGVSFEVPSNKMVALVGATGSGKSTVLKLLLRLHYPIQGNITIDGHDLQNSAPESLPANIGVVPQNPLLLHDTVLNNILCGNSFASEDQVYGACKAVALHEKLNSLPKGYQTILGEADTQLSGGELQRLALARVIVKNPKIIILDEATSSVDSNTEALIQRNLKEFCKDKTIIIVANRLSTVAKTDKIVVLRHGRVCEQGSHTSLLKAKGYYNRLWSRQSKTKNPKSTVKDANSEQKQKQKVQDTADLIDVSDTRAVADVGATTGFSTLRHTGQSNPATPYTGVLRKDELGNDHTRLNNGSSKSMLKPDAPEFVPTSQRVFAAEPLPQQEYENEHRAYLEHHEAEEENETQQGMLDANDGRTGEPAKKGKGSKRKHSRRASSILRQTSNGVVMAYPKKARKTAEDSKKRSLRQRRIESEPIGVSFLSTLDQ